MSRRDPTFFRKTRLALAVAALCASLGACSTVPREEGLGSPVDEAGRTTADSGSGLWDRTLYLLGFGGAEAYDTDPGEERRADEPRLAGANDTRLLDEVDLALAKEDAVMPSSGTRDAASSSARPETVVADAAGERTDEELFDGERVLVENRADGESLPVSGNALTHEVGASETLWDIAKRTTGDATNWHVLADVNDLAPDAAVYPGQTIVVPADMVRPELVGFTTTAEADAAADGAPGTGSSDTATEVAGGNWTDLPDETDAAADLPETEAEILAAEVSAGVDAAVGGTSGGGTDTASADTGGTELRLGAGETLWDFAKRTTGDATNWRAIAEANGFSEEEAALVHENMSITVPTALLRDDAPEGAGEPDDVAEVGDAAGTDDGRDALVPIEDAVATANGAVDALVAPADDADSLATADDPDQADEDGPIRIVEAAYRTEPDVLVGGETTEDAAALAAASVAEGTAPEEIMVSGTYYPKAVYNDADFSSSLLMRVSPGTKLLVSRAVGSWYEVATDQGTGYVHARDIK